jgi:hypothetical protein
LKINKVLVRLEAGIALVAGALGILTVFWRDWIEMLTGWDPDHHDGRAEWLIVAALMVVAAVAGAMAHRHWARLTASAGQARNYVLSRLWPWPRRGPEPSWPPATRGTRTLGLLPASFRWPAPGNGNGGGQSIHPRDVNRQRCGDLGQPGTGYADGQLRYGPAE